MKVMNIILSILILILALASATFSYFLFEKRDTMIKGWGKLATTIHNTSTALDNHSNTKEAAKLTPAELSHEKYAELDAKLQKLVAQSRRIIAERDELADALLGIGKAVGVRNLGSKEEFRAVATYNTNKNAVVRGVSESLDRRDAVYRKLAEDARKIGVRIDPRELASNGTGALEPFSRAISQARTRREFYENNLQVIGSHANVRNSDFSESGYRDSVQKTKQGVEKVRRAFDAKTAELDDVRRELVAVNAELKKRDIHIKSLNDLVSEKNYTIKSYKSALGVPEEEEPPTPWHPGSKEVRAKTVGEVVKVNSDYGYIAINLGKNTLVKQSLGTKTFEVNPQIEKGMEMVVARGRLDDNAAFVSRITLDEVGEDCSTANIPAGSKTIKVGDIVYFDKAQLK